MDFEAFRLNPMAVAAVDRKLQIISEAAIRLGSEAEQRCPDILVTEYFNRRKRVEANCVGGPEGIRTPDLFHAI